MRDHEEFNTVEGAFINAWIPASHTRDAAEAEEMARNHIQSNRWFIKGVEEYSNLDEEEYEPHEEEEEYYRLALQGEQIFVFNTYPHSDEEVSEQ